MRFTFSELNLSTSKVEEVLGYEKGETPGIVFELIGKLFDTAKSICNIKAEYIVYSDVKFHDMNRILEVNDIYFKINKIVYGQIKKSESIAVFLCTAGEEIGKLSRKCMKEGDLLDGFIYDVIGSEMVEAAADLMQNKLKNEMAEDRRKITNRYSPGYCGWDVIEQHKLFRLIPDNYCGIKLTASALMDPLKSISGIIGIGENVKFNPYTCGLCDSTNCIYRDIKERWESGK